MSSNLVFLKCFFVMNERLIIQKRIAEADGYRQFYVLLLNDSQSSKIIALVFLNTNALLYVIVIK